MMAVSVCPHHFKGTCSLHLQGFNGSRQYVSHNAGNYSLQNTMSHRRIKQITYCVVCYYVDMLIEISRICLPYDHQDPNLGSHILLYQNAMMDECVNIPHLRPVKAIVLVESISVGNILRMKLQDL